MALTHRTFLWRKILWDSVPEGQLSCYSSSPMQHYHPEWKAVARSAISVWDKDHIRYQQPRKKAPLAVCNSVSEIILSLSHLLSLHNQSALNLWQSPQAQGQPKVRTWEGVISLCSPSSHPPPSLSEFVLSLHGHRLQLCTHSSHKFTIWNPLSKLAQSFLIINRRLSPSV